MRALKSGQPGEFVGRPIEVATTGEVRVPASFRLGDREYEVAEILETWQDHGFGMASPLKKNWRLRHHRSYFRVRTAEGEVFELYLDRTRVGLRAGAPRRWFLYRRLPAGLIALVGGGLQTPAELPVSLPRRAAR